MFINNGIQWVGRVGFGCLLCTFQYCEAMKQEDRSNTGLKLHFFQQVEDSESPIPKN